jgi:SAM-dependent methyltransferase
VTGSDIPGGALTRFQPSGEGPLQRHGPDELALELLRRLRAGQLPDLVLAGLLGTELERHANRHLNRYGNQYLYDLFHRLVRFPGGGHPEFRGATVVNLGCGSHNPLGLSTVFLLLGAARSIGVDIDPPQEVAAGLSAIAKTAATMLLDPRILVGETPIDRRSIEAGLAGFDFRKLLAGDASGLPTGRLEFRRESVYQLGLADRSVDFVISNSFLEHLGALETALSEIARITKAGAYGSHAIDGVDHRSYSDPSLHPLEFLRDRSDAPLLHGCNRVRPLEYPQLFERHGFEVVDFMPYGELQVSEADRAGYVEPYRSMTMDQLWYGAARIVVRRT